MPDIYTNAYVTVFASSASSCHDGFLATRCEICDDIVLRYQGNGVDGPIRILPPNKEEDDPIYRGAWTLQEREVSPRFLNLGSQGIIAKLKDCFIRD